MRRFFAFSAVTLAAAVLAGCGGNGSAGTCNPGPNLSPPLLLYPIPGATGVPDNAGLLVVANVGPASGTLYIVGPSGGTGIAAQQLGPVPSPAPSPAASAPAGSTQLAAQIPNLSAQTSYKVNFVSNPPGTCVQSQSSGTLGTFSTQ